MRRLSSLLTAALLTFGLTTALAPQATAAGLTARYDRIPTGDGVALTARVYTPASTGKHPLVVLPASWAAPTLEYEIPARKLAERGYVVVSYTARGFYTSGGEVEVGSANDVADARAVIDWALANTPASATRIGMAGISYGAGFSLLTAAADPRIKAVAALSTWSDLEKSLGANDTWSAQGIAMLGAAGKLTGRFGPELDAMLANVLANEREPVKTWAAPRSPGRKLAQLNANKPAVLIANAWQDGLFPPDQVVELFNGLRGPKRLELAPGDHATPEAVGLAGLPNDTWETTYRWLDHYLRGTDNGVDAEPPVRLKPTIGGAARNFTSWSALTASTSRRYLGDVNPLIGRTGELATSAKTGWTHTANGGIDTVADSGPLLLAGGATQIGLPIAGWLPAVSRLNAGVWQTEQMSRRTTVSGTPKLHVTVTPSAPDTSLFAYLYDVDGAGIGRLLSHKPVTLVDRTAGAAQQLDFTLQPVLHDLDAGHRLVLVIDTKDPRYSSETALGERLTFTSPAASPSYLDIPLG
ncbi:CocE/NonD family hydrolase [Allokutzneria sp. A3M-2-11 16]|uniref:CocE/NonD family hydrolase n=1 Tax=Allokutzneria sp. A3M-2-11 16 TaxID=2962043 RepID=UPI0020B6DC4D|nr:CocE/NonD family hydrolase [Allokutzneria sp. A3M-2-11 16]MCP3798625.1 CocE/NonD family hydrolase [Allokutzneria sp. A3M-2-11 16]